MSADTGMRRRILPVSEDVEDQGSPIRDNDNLEDKVSKLIRKSRHQNINCRIAVIILSIFIVLSMLLSFSPWAYIWYVNPLSIKEDLKTLETRVSTINATGVDVDPAGLCNLLDANVDIDCLRDVIATGANEGDILTKVGSDFIPQSPNDICPASCINGTDGSQGIQGEPGINGTDGIDCWDLNENGICDLPEEDINNDGVCNVTDCRGESGNSTSGINGTDGIDCWDLNENGVCDLPDEDINNDGVCNVTDCTGAEGPTVDLCLLPDVFCGNSSIPNNGDLLFYNTTLNNWTSDTLTYENINGDICSFLESSASIDCLSDVNAPTPTNGLVMIGNGTHWGAGSVNFSDFVSDICSTSSNGLNLECLDNVDINNGTSTQFLGYTGFNWQNKDVSHSDLVGQPRLTTLKGIGGGVAFSPLNDATTVLVPSVLGTVNFTGGQFFRDLGTGNEAVTAFAWFGNDFGGYEFNCFFYNSLPTNETLYFYEYSLDDMNSGSPVAGNLAGFYTTETVLGHDVGTFLYEPTVSPGFIVPQANTSGLYIKAVL